MKYMLSACLLGLLLSGCKAPEKVICNKWQIVNITFDGDIPVKDKEDLRKNFMAQKTILFNSDHTMQIGNEEPKKWRLSVKADTLFFQEKDIETVTLIRKLSTRKSKLECPGKNRSYSVHLSAVK
ncbi:MAG: hypothetical protein V4615_13605 [Bacteroidota bacterium]